MPRRVGLAALLLVVIALVAVVARPSPREVVVLLGGDVHGEPPIAETLAAGADPLASLTAHLDDADIVVVNLETPVRGTAPEEPADKAILFLAEEVLLDRLAGAGVDVVSLANNHALDQGAAVLAETIAMANERGIAAVGAGPDEATAWAPALIQVDGRRVAVLGMTDVVPDGWAAGDGWGVASALDHDRAAEAVREAADRADHVVVTVHWGTEFRDCPSVVQTELARRLVEAGAGVVAGHHPHVVQGVEERDGAVVAYSLGNLVFYAATPETRDAVLLRVALRDAADSTLVPVVLDDAGHPQPADSDAATRIAERVHVRSPGGGTCPVPVWEGLPHRRDR